MSKTRRRRVHPNLLPPFLRLRSKETSDKRASRLKGYFSDHPDVRNEEFYETLSTQELVKAICGLMGFRFAKDYLSRVALRRLLYYLTGVRKTRKDIFDYYIDGRYGDITDKVQAYKDSKDLDPKHYHKG